MRYIICDLCNANVKDAVRMEADVVMTPDLTFAWKETMDLCEGCTKLLYNYLHRFDSFKTGFDRK